MWQSISTFVFRLFLIHPCDSRNPRLNFRSQRRALRVDDKGAAVPKSNLGTRRMGLR